VGRHAHGLVDDHDVVVVVDDGHAGNGFGDDLEGRADRGAGKRHLQDVAGANPVGSWPAGAIVDDVPNRLGGEVGGSGCGSEAEEPGR
jgi:hypothetical protein